MNTTITTVALLFAVAGLALGVAALFGAVPPEPAVVLVLLAGGLGLLRRRR